MASGKWEYGQLFSGGGYLTFNESPEVEAIYPLADRLRAGMRHGGHVYRRAVIVISDWEEIGPRDVEVIDAYSAASPRTDAGPCYGPNCDHVSHLT